MMYLLTALIFLVPTCYSNGVVWIRMSSTEPIGARIEFVDKENSSRYGISFDLQLSQNLPKEYVLPMPPSSDSIPILDYTIQMFHPISGKLVGTKSGNRLPLLMNEPWIHRTVSTGRSLSIFVSIRFECLPHYFGSRCQNYCVGEKCGRDQCAKKSCQNNSKCQFNGFDSKCICQNGYSGGLCEIKKIDHFNYVLICVVVIFIFSVLVFISIIVKCPSSKLPRVASEPVENYSIGRYPLNQKPSSLTTSEPLFTDV